MSKSIGNAVSVVEAVERVSPTGLRYFLFMEGVPLQKELLYESFINPEIMEVSTEGVMVHGRLIQINDIRLEELIVVANRDLANNLGNLLRRCTGPKINVDQIAPSISEADFHALGQEGTDLFNSLHHLPREVLQHFQRLEFKKGLESIMLTLTRANKLLESKKPWELKKKNKMDDVYLILGACIETLRIVGTIMQPIVPSLSSKLLDRLNVDANQREWTQAIFTEQLENRPLGEDQTQLFKRIPKKELQEEKTENEVEKRSCVLC